MTKLTKRQKEIIANALLLTAHGGIQNLTIKNLADSLGITEPAIYRHFKNKSEIVKTMIRSFEAESAEKLSEPNQVGLAGIEDFVKSRFALVASNPPLAKVMFAEELFMDDPEYSELLVSMMHKHKAALTEMFATARELGEIRSDIRTEMLFRLILGPVRLVIKQWGMSRQGFDLVATGNELWEEMRKLLAP